MTFAMGCESLHASNINVLCTKFSLITVTEEQRNTMPVEVLKQIWHHDLKYEEICGDNK
jgi:hypothetical protein